MVKFKLKTRHVDPHTEMFFHWWATGVAMWCGIVCPQWAWIAKHGNEMTPAKHIGVCGAQGLVMLEKPPSLLYDMLGIVNNSDVWQMCITYNSNSAAMKT